MKLGSLFGTNRPGRRARLASRRPRFDPLEGRQLLTTYTVTNTSDLAISGSLRTAIENANSHGGPDIIEFNIAGTGVHQIVTSGLPTIKEAVTIDGTTQPGFQDRPLIEITGVGADINGLTINGSGTVIKGIALDDFGKAGLLVQNASNITLQGTWIGFSPSSGQVAPNNGGGLVLTSVSGFTIGGEGSGQHNVIGGNLVAGIRLDGGTSSGTILGNFIGADPSGSSAIPNAVGIDIASANSITIGGSLPADANVISGNTGNGIQILGSGNRSIQVLGNIIGGDATGTNANGNGGAGIAISQAVNTQIGSLLTGTGNTIVSNGGNGIQVDNSTNTNIFGNWIGTDPSGTVDLGNKGDGILITSDNVVVGGTVNGQPNVIAFNGDGTDGSGGVVVASGRHNPILGNQIYANKPLGIDLGADGVTSNDPTDLDSGANGLQNYPFNLTAVEGAGRTLVRGAFQSTPLTTFLIQYFSTPQNLTSGAAQGMTLIGSETVTTGSNGVYSISAQLNHATRVGDYVTATATQVVAGGNGETSEFSPGVQIGQASVADIRVDVTDSVDPANVNSAYNYVVTVTNRGPDAASNVQVDVAIPQNLSLGPVNPTQGSYTLTSTGLTANLGTIPSGGTARITITVTPTLTGTYTVKATATHSDIDTDISNDSASQTTLVTVPTDVAVMLSQDPSPGVEGQDLTYVVILKNNGPGTAENVVITAPLPAGAAFVGAAVGQGSVTRVTGVDANMNPIDNVVASLGPVPNGGVVALRIVVSPSGVGTFPMTVTASADNESPQKLDNNTATLSAVVKPAADLAVTAKSDLAQPLGGDTVTYTFTAKSNGPTDATNVVFRGGYDPNAFDLVAATTSDGQQLADPGATGGVSATLEKIQAGGTATLILTLKAKVGFVGKTTVNGSATTEDEVDLVPADNSASITTPINAAELSIGLKANPNPAIIGSNLTYAIDVRNAGPANASNVVVTVNFPQDADFLSASGAPVVTDVGAAQFTLASLPAGQTRTLTLVLIPRISGGLSTTARLTSFDALDVNASNNSATLTVPISPADVAVALTSSTSKALVGDTIRYEAVVTNNGPVPAVDVALVNTLPGGVRFVSASTSKGSVGNFGTDVTAQFGTLAPGESVHVVFDVSAAATGSQVVKSRIGSTTYDSVSANNQASAGVQVSNAPGTIQFAQNLFVVQENASVAHLTLNRTGGTQGSVTVRYALTPGNALPGVNYNDVSGTVTFNDGETSKTIDVPILVDGKITGPLAFNATLSQPTGGATIGSRGTSTVGIVNTDFDLAAPTVTNLTMNGTANAITSITVTFSEALNPGSAGFAPNFAIVAPDGSRPTLYPPLYDPATNSVTMVPVTPLAGGRFYYVVVNSQGLAGVQDLAGNRLDGDANGVAGGDYVVSVARGTQLKYGDADGDLVSLGLSRGGYLEMIRGLDGNAQILRVVAPAAGQSVLTGSVRRQGYRGNGTTTIGRIDGLTFGLINSRLTSPPFYVAGQLSSGLTSASVLAASPSVPRATAALRFANRRGG
jgi:uncharacterized repeat protein (TIGR01451 family)